MQLKRTLSILTAVAILIAAVPVFADAVPTAGSGNVIYHEDFSDNILHTTYGGYYVNSGTVVDGKYKFSGTNDERLIYTAPYDVSGGTVCISADFNLEAAGDIGKLMASADKDNGAAYNIRVSGGKLQLQAYADKDTTKTTNYNIMDCPAGSYTIEVYIDLDNGLLQLAVNGNRKLADKKIYINPNSYKSGEQPTQRRINRLFDSHHNKTTAGNAYTVDNITATRMAGLPYKGGSVETVVEKETFTSFSETEYTGSDYVATSIVPFGNVATDTDNHGNVMPASGTRLCKELSVVDGIYTIKEDLYFTANGKKGRALNVGKDAAYLMVDEGSNKIILRAGADSTATSASNLGTRFEYPVGEWFTLETTINTQTREITVSCPGKNFSVSGYMLGKTADYKRIFDINNTITGYNMSGVYFDNISVEKVNVDQYTTSSKWEQVLGESTFDNNLNEGFSHFPNETKPVWENGTAKFVGGARAYKSITKATTGTYVVEADVKIPVISSNETMLLSAGPNSNFYATNNNIMIKAYDSTNTRAYKNVVQNFDISKWYNIKAMFSLDTRRLHVYVDGIEVLADNELYMCKSTDTLSFDKIYNINNAKNEVAFYLDNIKGYRDILAENLALDSGKLVENLASGTLKTTIKDSESTDVAVIWTSDDSAVLSADGVLGAARVNKYPTLQATVDDTNGRATRRYTFYVPGVAGIYENKKGVTEDLNDLTFVTKENGKIVTWTSSHPEIITSTGKVTRPQETTTVTMTATCDGVDKAFTIEVLGLREANSVIVTANDLTVSGKTATYSPRVYNSTAEAAYITPILAVYNKATDNLETVIVKPTITVASESYSADETVTLTIPDGGEYYVKGFLWDKINSSKPYISARTEAKTENAKMFIISDSTYAHYNTNSRNQAGIGMFLGNYFNDKMTVVNHAVGGSSSRSWLTLEDASGEKFKQVLDAANSGDYMLISFGINDKTNRDIRYVAIDEMDDYLSIYVQAAKDRGITPILVTSILAAQYTTEGGNVTSIEYESAVEDRREAVRNYASTAGVELVDLSAEQKTYFDETYGAESSAYNHIKAFYIEEADGKTMVHFHNDSANIMAGMLAKLLKAANIDGLGKFFKN